MVPNIGVHVWLLDWHPVALTGVKSPAPHLFDFIVGPLFWVRNNSQVPVLVPLKIYARKHSSKNFSISGSCGASPAACFHGTAR